MTQIRLSYEEQILNALNRLTHKRNLSTLEWSEIQFKAIREVLKPLYSQVKELENEKKYQVARKMAIEYAGTLKVRLKEYFETDAESPESKISVYHLMKMCDKIISHTGYVPEEWSITKLHRWIGYIQGVMTSRGFTTVERERDDYKKIKTKILAEIG